MKVIFIIFLALLLFVACSKDNDPKEANTTIDGKTFTPSGSTVKKTGKSFVLTFTEGTKQVEITTSDTVAGTYTIVSGTLKSAAPLEAEIIYTDGATDYYGHSGTVEITKNSGGTISGSYDAKVVSAQNVNIEIKAGIFTSIKPVLVSNLLETETAINDSLKSFYTDFNEYVAYTFLFDAVYSNTTTAPNSSWTAVYTHSESASDPKVLSLWSKSYDMIFKTNLIIRSAEKVITDESKLSSIISQAKTLRAYSYLTLLSWFGGVPLEDSTAVSLIPRNTTSEVQTLIETDLSTAITNLPQTWSTDEKFRINKGFAKGLQARLYVLENNSDGYTNAKNVTQEVIASGQYSLDLDTINFKETGHEIFLGFNKANDTEFNNFFAKSTYVPVMRYTETLLIAAEASTSMGNIPEALSKINILRTRRGKPDLDPSLSANELKSQLLQQWKIELKLEGTSFFTLKRFGTAGSELHLTDYKLLLPVPILYLNQNPSLTQNPGY